MDVSITSTQIDLGLAQLVTANATNIGGSGELNLKLTGSPQSPIVDGTVRIANGTFMVAGGGVNEHEGDGRLSTFSANHLAIETLEIHDNDDHVLRATGGLDVLGDAEKRAFNVGLHADQFHVLRTSGDAAGQRRHAALGRSGRARSCEGRCGSTADGWKSIRFSSGRPRACTARRQARRSRQSPNP